MRSRSRERSSYVADQRGRERDNYRRDRSRDRDTRYGEPSKRSRDSRSRSRDRVKPRDRVNDSSRELREVKRILSNPTGDSKVDRDRRDNDRGRSDSLKDGREKDNRDRSRNDGAIQSNTTGRKTNYEDYTRHGSSRNDDDEARKDQKRLRREGSFHDSGDYKDKPKASVDGTPSRTENSKEGKENNGSAEKASRTENSKEGKENNGSAEKAYDEKELAEIEQFLAKTAAKTGTNGSTKEKTEPTTPGKAATSATTAPNEKESKSAANNKKEEEEEEEVDLLWEDEETIARREEQAAEERRKKRLEIASKYNNNANGNTNVDGEGNSGKGLNGVLVSPTKLAISAFDGTKGLPSPKAVVPIVDLFENSSSNNNNNNNEAPVTPAAATSTSAVTAVETTNLMENILPGNASLTVPTTSLHLAKLALDPSTTSEDEPSRDETERQQLENEKAALLQEERRERGMSDLSIGGYGGYGAGGRIEFDMFSASPSGIEETLGVGKKGQAVVNAGRRAMREQLVDQNNTDHTDPHLQSNWDDGEGYYKARIGECIGDRFRILGVVGKGVFSTVLKCIDLYSSQSNHNGSGSNGNKGVSGGNTGVNGGNGDEASHVAIKLIRNNDTMRKAAEKEKSILLSIAQADPGNTKYCVRLLTHLDYRNHVAMVFEYQSMNLRETLKKFGKDVGINIGAIRMYGKQLFVALDLLMKLRIVHADIKLDNILCSGDLKQIKLCDFGSAFRETDTDNDPTPYLVSRFYRAPEIILGMQYDRAIDLWSVCVCLYELFTGHVMFPGRTNNEMLKLMMAVKGKIQNKQIKTHMRAYEVLQLEPHFDPDMRFRQYEADPITGKTVLRLMDIQNPTRDLASVLRSSKAGADDMVMVTRLTDFLEKGLNLDPTKRLTVTEALKHPFFSSSSAAGAAGTGGGGK